MNVNYINPFINACIDVFKTFAGLISVPGKPVAQLSPTAQGDVKGIIGLNGHGISGYFIINFYGPFLEKITATLFGVDSVSSQEELNDLAGELTNMITGNAKAELSKKGFFFDVAVPRISHGTPKIPPALARTPVIMVPFTTKSGKYAIEASIKKIEEDFAEDTLPEVTPSQGYISVETFSKLTGIDPVKTRRLLKTGYISGKKISNKQWHIPEAELEKIHGYKKSLHRPARKTGGAHASDGSMSVEEFSKASGLTPAKVKHFLRTGFLKGGRVAGNTWRINPGEIQKFKTQKTI